MEDIIKFITVREASKLTGYNPDYLSSLIRSGKIKGQKVGRGWVTTKVEVDNYFNKALQPSALFGVLRTFKTGTLLLVATLIIALVVTVLYITVYEHGYQQAHAQATIQTTSDTTLNNSNDEGLIN